MKLQSLAIIFIIIVFPMILILSYYISLQIDTITLYNKYNNELIDATNDAMSAFELNTANEELSNVSDSLRSIIDASTNTFINTLSTSLGLSNVNKNDIEPYIPSILYTMYDGYYIYAPTKTPVILEKTKTENGIVTSEGAATVGDEGVEGNNLGQYTYTQGATAQVHSTRINDYGSLLYKVEGVDSYTTQINDDTEFKTDYVLKSYMPYSATYVDGTNIATINYTLDNFMSVSAQIGDVYYTKSGYYIDTSLINNCNIPDWNTMGQDELKEYCLNTGNYVNLTINGITIETVDDDDSKKTEVKDANRKAITYYLTNTAFSNWVNNNLGFCVGQNMQIADNTLGYISENTEMFHDFSTDDQVIFDTVNDPENEDSAFNNHKYNIIKNSIQYNLNLAISSYSDMFQGLTFEMPQLNDTEWEEITEKISIVSFMQGLDCGLKEFSGYAIVSSTNNEMTVIPEEIYYVESGVFNNEESYYHRIDCENIRTYSGDFISFKSKEVKYDDIYKGEELVGGEGYEYDHRNLACYDCIVQNNYSNYNDGTNDKKIKLRAFLGFEEDSDEEGSYINDDSIISNLSNLQKAYYIAIGKERQNQYKTTAYSKNEGIKVEDSANVQITGERIKAEVTIEVTQTGGIVEEIAQGVLISTSSKSIQTVEINNSATIPTELPGGAKIQVRSIKYIYK